MRAKCPHRKVIETQNSYIYTEVFADCDGKYCPFFREGVGENYCDNPTNFTQAIIKGEINGR